MNKLRIVKRNDTVTFFDPVNGSVLIDGDNNCDTPFLLDVSLRNICNFNCPYCYKDKKNHINMSMENFDLLLEKMVEAHVFEVAYGGGNPNEHPYFIDILKRTYEAGIIPSYSSNGDGLTSEIIDATASYCGAIAISIHKRVENYQKLTEQLTSKIQKVNFHFVMMHENYEEIVKFLVDPPCWALKLNAIVLLRYKRTSFLFNEPTVDEYKKIFDAANKSTFKVAFDACSFPLIKKFLPDVDTELYDYCQGSRCSAYINENLIMSPCSFDKALNTDNNLHNFTIKEIFNNTYFKKRKYEINKNKICLQYFKEKGLNE